MKKSTSFEEQKCTRYIRENIYFGIIVFSCLSSTKPCLRFFFNLFCSGGKRLLSEFFRKWGWFQKTETPFCRWKSTDNNNINIFLSLENPCTFLLAKENTWKHIFNTNSELSQNRTEKQIMPSKTTVDWLFNDIRYLFIAFFDWKIVVFQQSVIRVYYILKWIYFKQFQKNFYVID